MRYIRSTACACVALFFILCAFIQRTDILFDTKSIQEFWSQQSKVPSKSDERTSQWAFNRPLEMRIRGGKDRKAIKQQNEEQRVSNERLSNMTQILYYNSDAIPINSAFGTKDGSRICQGSDERKCVPKFKHFETRIRYAPKYKTVGCLMQKSMSTILQAIICYLYDEKAFQKAGRVLSRESYNSRFCRKKNEMNTELGNKLWSSKVKVNAQWLHLAVVRDPVDRFLSGFVDKCLRSPVKSLSPIKQREFRKPKTEKFCNGCRSNMTCFLVTEYKRVYSEMKKKQFQRSFEDRHFFPQNWRCDFRWHFDNYNLLHYRSSPNATDEFIAQLFPLLRKQKVSETSLKFISDQLKGGRTVHSTVASEARQFFEKRLLNSPFLMEYVVRLFYFDFKLFGYKLPKINFNS